MKSMTFLLLCVVLGVGVARASVDFSSGSLYRTAGVPAWSNASGSFTIMLWVYGPAITGANDYFNADDGGAQAVFVNLGSPADSPKFPYFLTRTGEFHYNTDGTATGNAAAAFDVSLGWTFLAVSFTLGGETDLYAWQAGVNSNQLVRIVAQPLFSSIGGSGTVTTFEMGNQSGFGEGCSCLMGPVYVYDGLALSQSQVDAQRQQLAPVLRNGLIVYSSFVDGGALAADQSGTANWSVHGSLGLNSSNPPPAQGAAGSGNSNGGSGDPQGNSGGAPAPLALLVLAAAACLRRRPVRCD
jgi:MYXO-CTERM domain-containing protein